MIDFYSVLGRKRSIVMSVSVCLSVRTDITGITCSNVTKFPTRVVHGRASFLLCRRCDTLRTSGFVDDVMFQHNRARQ